MTDADTLRREDEARKELLWLILTNGAWGFKNSTSAEVERMKRMVKEGLIKWNQRAHGYILTDKGRILCGKLFVTIIR